MASFYGNIKNNSRASFIFDKIYSSRQEMEETLHKIDPNSNIELGDGIFVNRYVLIDYNFDSENKIFVDRYSKDTLQENSIYAAHREQDANKYGANYDGTVWMKIYVDKEERYIMVAALNAVSPTFELLPDAPSEQNGEPHFDLRYSDELNYKYHVPKNWDFILNKYNPSLKDTYSTTDNNYYYYEQDKEDIEKTFNPELEYPYYNQNGFNPIIQSHIDDIEDNLLLTETKSNSEYPQEEYIPIELTIDTYQKNKYYIPSQFEEVTSITPRDNNLIYYKKELKDQKEHYVAIRKEDPLDNNVTYYLPVGEYQKSLDDYEAPGIYYMISQKYDGDQALFEHKIDTKRLDICLPSVGNAASELYDALYGKPQTGILLGWTNNYTQYALANGEKPNAIHTKIIVNENNEITQNLIFLEPNEYKELSKVKERDPNNDPDPTYIIPVFSYGEEGYRPYIKELIFDNDETYYGNVDKDTESFSAGWGIDILKKYIDELRQLAFGSDGNGGIGLQGDFTQTDSTAFGYIWNKPEKIGYYQLVPKNIELNNDYSYYKQIIDENEIRTFEKVTENNLKIQLQDSGELFTKQPTHEEIEYIEVQPNDSYEKWKIYYIKDLTVPAGYRPKLDVNAGNFNNIISSDEKLYYKKINMVEPEETIEDMWHDAEIHDMTLKMWEETES